MHRIFIFLLGLGVGQIASAQVILSEVMFNPQGNENTNEFLEIFNASTTDSAWLKGWRIGDQIETDLLVSPGSIYWLAPGQFGVVLDPGYFQSSAIYDSLIPAGAIIFTIDDNTFGSGGLSNSTPETILLINADGDTAARYQYSLDNANGISDEKVHLSTDDSPTNWTNSRRIDGTPGQRNSVAPRRIDGELLAESLSNPRLLREGQSADIDVILYNAGLETITNATVEFWMTRSTSMDLSPPFRLGSADLASALLPGHTAVLGMVWENTIAGRHEIVKRLLLQEDEESGNDTLRTGLIVSHRREVVHINEIMYSPPSGQPEWVEIFNPQPRPLSLAEWTLQDESGLRGLVPNGAVIPAHGFLVLAASAAVGDTFGIADSLVIVLDDFPTLNNDGDVLLLRDFGLAVIDSVAYDASWGGRGISAEKAWHERDNNSENWRPSRDRRGGTPGNSNSTSPREVDLTPGRVQFDPPQPRAGEDVSIIATVRNSGRRVVERFNVTFAADRNHDNEIQDGEAIGILTVEQTIPAEDSLTVRWLWPQPASGRRRILIAVSAPADGVSENNRIIARLSVGYTSRSVVINEIYYAPRSNEVEWVELYNRSAGPVDLSEWRWRDADAELPIVMPDLVLILPPGGFAILGAGYKIPQAVQHTPLIVPKTWLTLNNDQEQLVLADFNGQLQDSLAFTRDWGGGNGISLERINPHLASADSNNWSSCVDQSGSTPGQRNSIFTEFVPQQATLTVSPPTFSPDGDGGDDFVIIQIRVPATTATVHLKIFDVRGRLVRHLLNNAAIGAMYDVAWNGQDDDSRPVPMGIYIIYMQAIHATRGVLVSARTTLVLARQLN